MANNNLAAIAQLWAREGLKWLIENCVELSLVNKQFSNTLAKHGETVNAYRAGTRKTRRKIGTDGFTHADANLEPVPVPLNQWFYDSCVLRDDELSLSIVDLIPTHLGPMMGTIGRGLSRAVSGRAAAAFLQQGTPAKRAGKLNGMTAANAAEFVLEAEEVLNLNNAPQGTKVAVVHPTANTKLMLNELFARADARGTLGSVATGAVGRIYNTDVFMSQCVNYANAALLDTQVGAVNNSPGGYAAGHASAMTVTDPGDNYAVGEYVVIAGNDQPTYVAVAGSATSITLNEPLKYAVAHDAVITHYKTVTNEAVTRAAGYQKEMTFTHTSGKPLRVGQMISFGTTTRHTYTIIEATQATATTTTVLLDRPLDAQVLTGADAFPGPGGAINYTMDRDALTLVTRPPILVPAGFGVEMSVQSYKGIGLRVAAQYDSLEGGVRINADILAGVAPLNEDLLCTLLS